MDTTVVSDKLEDCKQRLAKNERDENLQFTYLPIEVWGGKSVQEGQGLTAGPVKMTGDCGVGKHE